MSKTVRIESPAQFTQVISASKVVVIDFFADWCGPCKAIAPYYEQLSQELSRPGKITFTKVNVDHQQQIAQSYNVTAMPTFLILKNKAETTRIRGADQRQLQDAVKKLAREAESTDSGASDGPASSSSSGSWRGAMLPLGYRDVTDQIDTRGLEILNVDPELGNVRTMFHLGKPSAMTTPGGDKGLKDWVESDTDEQLMLYMPFLSTLKVHTLHITSLPPSPSEDPMRPKTLRLYTNTAHNLGFEQAEDTEPTQEIELKPELWDKENGTVKVELRFVKFQKCNSMVVFFVDGEGSGEKIRVDRVRVIGEETGMKRDVGKLEKIGHES